MRMTFSVVVVLIAMALMLAACLVGMVGAVLDAGSTAHGAGWKATSRSLMSAAGRVAKTADNHRRWVLPNKPAA